MQSANRISDLRAGRLNAARTLSQVTDDITRGGMKWDEAITCLEQAISLFEDCKPLTSQEVQELSESYNQKGFCSGKLADRGATPKNPQDDYRKKEIDSYLEAIRKLMDIPQGSRDARFYDYLALPCDNLISTYCVLKQFSNALEMHDNYEQQLEPLKQKDKALYEKLMHANIWRKLWTINYSLNDNKFEDAENGLKGISALNSQITTEETRAQVKLAEMLLLLGEKKYSTCMEKRRELCEIAIEQLLKVDAERITDKIRRLFADSYFMLFESYPEDAVVKRKSALEAAAKYIEQVFNPNAQDKELQAKCLKCLAPYSLVDRLDETESVLVGMQSEMESVVSGMQKQIEDLRRGIKRGALSSSSNILLPQTKYRKPEDKGADYRPATESIPSPR